jgi:N6-L-threonylcarbamoyladenine synthase
MIAFAGALRLQAGQRDDAAVRATPRWDMADLPPLAETRDSGSMIGSAPERQGSPR